MHPMLTIALRAARNAGKVIVKAYEQRDQVEIDLKGNNDYVTSVDREAEEAIVETIRKSYPDHSIVAEERGQDSGENTDFQWVIDPLDGTTNFINGIPHFAVSIALREKGVHLVAVIYDPLRDELFSAVRGQGAQLNTYRVRTGQAKDLEGTLLATGFPFKYKQHMESYMNTFTALFTKAGDVRRAGSAALDLAYVAAGRMDGFWEIGLRPWDIAAGELILREAGAMITDFNGGHDYMKSGNVVAGNPTVVKSLLSAIRPPLNEGLKG